MSTERIRGNLSTQSRLSGNLYRSGGGSTVTIEPVYNTGIKIADYSIDEDQGEIYIPNYPTYNKTLLYHNNTTSYENIVLSDDLHNYDELHIVYNVNADSGVYVMNETYITSTISDSTWGTGIRWAPNNEYLNYIFTDSTHINTKSGSGSLYIKEIYGINY